MKRYLIIFILTTVLFSSKNVFAENDYPMIKARATAYNLHGVTASGEQTRLGICAVGNPNYFGKTIIVYQRLPGNKLGRCIGIYEALDTGCHKNVVDVWCPDLECSQEFMNVVYEDGCGGKVFIQVIDAQG